VIPVVNVLVRTDYVIDAYEDVDDILAFDVSDEALEAAAGMEIGPHKTGCTKQCTAGSCS
jgi:hypothetical protein